MEGYYNNSIFHRLIKGFMVQTGDPTGTGHGGKSIYGIPFKNEFHSRLKFARHGIIAMAGGQGKNNSQFFITLAPCSWLNKRYTIFAKVLKKYFLLLEISIEIIYTKKKHYITISNR
jgi:cyclophilin family peptidyl-prolyl cis-trans isomerase